MHKRGREDKMTKIRKKLTTVIIILLGLLVTTPTLFADPVPAHRGRPVVRQEVARRPHRRLSVAGFLNRPHRQIRRKKIRRQVRRNISRRMNREHAIPQHQCNNCNHRGYNRP